MNPPVHTRWRGEDKDAFQQLDVWVEPTDVLAGEENVLVATGTWVMSQPAVLVKASSFLGVVVGDKVEMAVDVVCGQLCVYERSIHKETIGIYDAWDHQDTLPLPVTGGAIVLTCRVVGENEAGKGQARFHGLVRLTFRRRTQ